MGVPGDGVIRLRVGVRAPVQVVRLFRLGCKCRGDCLVVFSRLRMKALAVLSHFGFSLVWIPLIWICVASVVRLRPKISESKKELAFQTGWWILVALWLS